MTKTYLWISLLLALGISAGVKTLTVPNDKMKILSVPNDKILQMNEANTTQLMVNGTRPTQNTKHESGNETDVRIIGSNNNQSGSVSAKSSKQNESINNATNIQNPEIETENLENDTALGIKKGNTDVKMGSGDVGNANQDMENQIPKIKEKDPKIGDKNVEVKSENPEVKSNDTKIEIENSNIKIQEDPNPETKVAKISEKNKKRCQCSDLGALNYCSCTGPAGLIANSGNETGLFTYNIGVETGEKLLVYFRKEDIQFENTDNCSLFVGNKAYTNLSMILENNTWMTTKATNITALNGNGRCRWLIKYRIATEYKETSEETDLKGVIQVPVDPDALQNYRPRTKRLWNIAPAIDNCSLGINVTKLDLGSNSLFFDDIIAGENNTNKADFLVIGAGHVSVDAPISPQDTILYGGSESQLAFTFEECQAHIFFVSDMHYQNVSGFQISYAATDTYVEQENPDQPPNEHQNDDLVINIVVNLQGVIIENSQDLTNLTVKFKESITEIGNKYVQEKRTDLKEEILNGNNIIIYEIRECSVYCREPCTAFNFSVRITPLPDGEYLLSKDVFSLLLRRKDLQRSWRFKNSEVCDVYEVSGWKWFGLGGIINLLILLLVISLVWKSKEVFMNTKIMRGRTESEISNFPVSSHTSTSHNRRFNLPRRKKDENFKEPAGWNYNISGFTQFDPIGERIDPVSVGLDEPTEDCVHDRQSVTFYSNTAYDGDEHELFSQAAARGLPLRNEVQVAAPPSQPDLGVDDDSDSSDFEPFESSL